MHYENLEIHTDTESNNNNAGKLRFVQLIQQLFL